MGQFALRLLASVALALSTLAPAGSAPDPFTISVIHSGTGADAYSGKIERTAVELYEKLANSQGGINGRPVHFEFYDDQSDPRIAVQTANQLLVNHPSVIIGPGNGATCAAVAPLMVQGPVDFCFTPGFTGKRDGFVFSASTSLHYMVPAMLRFARLKGWKRIGVFSGTNATGQASDTETRYAMTLPENKDVKIVDWETFNASDSSAAAQIARLKAADPQVIFTPTFGGSFTTLIRGMNDAGLRVPVVASGANLQPELLKSFASIAPGDLYFNGLVYYAQDAIRPGPLRSAMAQFFDAYKAAGIEPTPVSGQGWDPPLIVVSALRKLGTSASPEALREYISHLGGFAGASGIYDFRSGDMHGLDDSSVIMVKFDPQSGGFVNVTKLGGIPL